MAFCWVLVEISGYSIFLVFLLWEILIVPKGWIEIPDKNFESEGIEASGMNELSRSYKKWETHWIQGYWATILLTNYHNNAGGIQIFSCENEV